EELFGRKCQSGQKEFTWRVAPIVLPEQRAAWLGSAGPADGRSRQPKTLGASQVRRPTPPGDEWIGVGAPAIPGGEMVNEEASVFRSPGVPAYLFDRARLVEKARSLAPSYRSAAPFPHIVIDDFLPGEVLDAVLTEFPSPQSGSWEKYNDA